MSNTTNKTKLRDEVKAIANAKKLAKKAEQIYKDTEALMKAIGANPFLVKKGINVKCNARTQKNKNTVQFVMNCTISLPAEIVK